MRCALTGDIDGALHAYQEALTQRAVYPEVYNNLGTLLQQDRKLEEAEHALRKAIQQNPRYVEAHNNLAQLLFAQKNEVEALRILGDALKFAPKNVQTLLLTAQDPAAAQRSPGGRAGDAAGAEGGARESRGADPPRPGAPRDGPL